MPVERVQVARQRGDQRLAFAGLHFGDLAVVQHHAADQLHVEMAHVQDAPAGFADHREGLDQEVGQDLADRLVMLGVDFLAALGLGPRFIGNLGNALLYPAAEFVRFGPQFLVAKLLHLRLEGVNRLHVGQQSLDLALVFGPEDLS